MKMLPNIGPFANMQQAADKVDEKQTQSRRSHHQLHDAEEREQPRDHQRQSRRKRIAAVPAPACRK